MKKPPMSVVLAVLVNDNKVLLIKREKSYYKGLWSLPGGKIEKEEHISNAAIREIEEETGITSEFISHLGCVSEHLIVDGKIDQHFLLHVCHLMPKTTKILETPKTYEGKVEWFDLGKLEEMKPAIIPSDYLMIKKMLFEKEKNYYNCVIERCDNKHLLRMFE